MTFLLLKLVENMNFYVWHDSSNRISVISTDGHTEELHSVTADPHHTRSYLRPGLVSWRW
jgi:hypothetical protein